MILYLFLFSKAGVILAQRLHSQALLLLIKTPQPVTFHRAQPTVWTHPTPGGVRRKTDQTGRMSKRTDRLQSKAGITRWNSPAVKNAPTAVWVLHCQTGSAISVLVTLCHRPLLHLTTRHRRRNHLFTHHTWTQRWPRASTPGICVNVIVTHIKSALIHIFLLSVSGNFAICYYEWPYVLVMERP